MSKITKKNTVGDKLLTPQQQTFLDLYYTPSSETFGNIMQSALKAGYSESYARVMGTPAINNLWIRYNNKTSLEPNHITTLIEKIALSKNEQAKDKLRALELLAKFQGMVVDKSENKNLNIEAVLADLK